jgi:hypothetical protein
VSHCFTAKIEALAQSYIGDDSSLSSVDMTESELSYHDDKLAIGPNRWTSEVEDLTIRKEKEFPETALYGDYGPTHKIDWDTTGNGFF